MAGIKKNKAAKENRFLFKVVMLVMLALKLKAQRNDD